jgi:hypothetical protein
MEHISFFDFALVFGYTVDKNQAVAVLLEPIGVQGLLLVCANVPANVEAV